MCIMKRNITKPGRGGKTSKNKRREEIERMLEERILLSKKSVPCRVGKSGKKNAFCFQLGEKRYGKERREQRR